MASKIASGLVRRRFSALRVTAVPLDGKGTKIWANLAEPLGQSLYRYGFLAPEAGLVESILTPGDVFIDGGAHVGLFSLIGAATVGGTGKVIACEPVAETLELLESNLALNRFHWVETRNVALADGLGQASFFSFGPGSALSSFAPATLAGSQRHLVKTVSLDEVAGALASRVRLVKLDIEGAEVRAIQGASALFRAKADFVVEVEPEHLARQGTSVDALQSVFSAAGYQGYEIHGDRSAVVLVPVTIWLPPPINPNMFVSSRPPSALPSLIRVEQRR